MALPAVLPLPLVPLFLTPLALLHADLACHGSKLALALLSFMLLLLDLHLGGSLIRLGLLVERLLHAQLEPLLRGHLGFGSSRLFTTRSIRLS